MQKPVRIACRLPCVIWLWQEAGHELHSHNRQAHRPCPAQAHTAAQDRRQGVSEGDGGSVRKRRYIYGSFRRKIWEKFNKICVYCGIETLLFRVNIGFFSGYRLATIDHIIPFSRGGKCKENNFQLLCESCNSSKGAKYV